MPYVTSIEKMGIRKGIREGIQEGIQKGIQKGIQEGIHLSIRKLLLKGLTPDEVVKLLDIDMQTVLTIARPTETGH